MIKMLKLVIFDLDETLMTGDPGVLHPLAVAVVREQLAIEGRQVAIWTANTNSPERLQEFLDLSGFSTDEFLFMWGKEKCKGGCIKEDTTVSRKFDIDVREIILVDDKQHSFSNQLLVSRFRG